MMRVLGESHPSKGREGLRARSAAISAARHSILSSLPVFGLMVQQGFGFLHQGSGTRVQGS